MTATLHTPQPCLRTFHRRSLVQAGALALAARALPLTGQRVASAETLPAPRAKSVVIVFLTGAASHHDTFDMKPQAPAEIRGEFRPIATSTPGVHICEHLPQIAARADRYVAIAQLAQFAQRHRRAAEEIGRAHV